MIPLSIERISGARGAGLESLTAKIRGPVQPADVIGARDTARGEGPVRCEVTREEVEQATEDLNRMLEHINQRLSFKVHEGSERMIVYVIDKETNEVVRELPPEKFLDTIAKIREFIGILFDEWF